MLRFLRKSKKHNRPPTRPDAIGNEGGSQATLLGEGSGSQLSRASDAPTQIPEHESDATTKSQGQNEGGDEDRGTDIGLARRDRRDVTRGNAATEAAQAFAPLKAVLGAISAIYGNYEGTIPVAKKTKNLLSRIAELEMFFGVPPDDVGEKARRSELLRKLGGIEGELQSISERLPDHDDEDVFRLLEGLEAAISDYQMMQQMAIYEQGCKLIDAAETAILNNFRVAEAAEFRHSDRTGCLKGTRGAVLDEIEQWARDFNRPSVYWLNGLAGTGKSTIAQTVSERIFADGRLGASFFCSRDFTDRSNLRLIFPTLAVQLARKYTRFRSIFIPLVRSDPGIVHQPLYNQMKKLIVEPLCESAISTVIVIDALDECKDEEPASAILSVLEQFVSQIKKVKFFVTGRPEPRIREGFRLPRLVGETDALILHDVERSLVDSDIRLFFRHKLSEIAKRRVGLDNWPTREQLDNLCDRAAGLFVYAVATVKFIDRRYNSPKDQLDVLLLSPESTAVGKTTFRSNTTLDSLYLSILQEAFSDDDPKVRSVLGAIILAADPLSPSAIATLLGLSTEVVFLILSSVHSLLIFRKDDGSLAKSFQEDVDSPVRPFHKSFPDFITDPTRCTNDRFHISPSNHHTELLAGSLDLMTRTLERNMCRLPDAVTNSEVKDLAERTEEYISLALQYACKSWHKHLVAEHTTHSPEVASTFHRFLEKKFLFWLEVLSVLGAASRVIDALDVAARWLKASPTLDLVNDCFRFATGFFEVIEESAPHIYHSALPLSPRTSIVRRQYESYARPLARIVHGLPNSWEPSIAAVTFPSPIEAVVWSPCSRFIAIVWDKFKATIEILDAITLGRHPLLNLPLGESGGTRWLVFSPDTRLLTWFGKDSEKFISWDLRTGSLVSTIYPEQRGHTLDCPSAAHSTCGTMFGILFRKGHAFTISIYNVRTGTHVRSHSIEGPAPDKIWTYSECLRFTTIKSGSIIAWEVGFTATDPPTEVQSLQIPSDSHHNFLLHPNLSRLAFITGGRVKVWDTQNSRFLLDSADLKWPRQMSFSHDARFFACGTNGQEFYVWKETPSGYRLHQQFVSIIGASEPLISPSGESIIAFAGLTIQLWRTTDPATILSTASTQVPRRNEKSFILGFSPDGALAAVTRMGDETVTVLDLKSGTPRLMIDTSMKVHGLGVDGSTVVVVGEGKIASWNLSGEGHFPDARVNFDDSTRSTAFKHPPFPTSAQRPTTSVSPDLGRIAIVEDGRTDTCLHIYDVHTGRCLASVFTRSETAPWFSPDRLKIWCVTDRGEAELWRIVEDGEHEITELEHLDSTKRPPDGFPWRPSHNYSIVDGQWVLGSGGKRLLRLPPQWRSDWWNWMWGGRFLALLDHELPEPVIVELEE